MGSIGSRRARYDFYIRKEVERSPDLRIREYAEVCAYDMLFQLSRDPLTIEGHRPLDGHVGVGPSAIRRSLHVHFLPITRVSLLRPCGKAGARTVRATRRYLFRIQLSACAASRENLATPQESGPGSTTPPIKRETYSRSVLPSLAVIGSNHPMSVVVCLRVSGPRGLARPC